MPSRGISPASISAHTRELSQKEASPLLSAFPPPHLCVCGGGKNRDVARYIFEVEEDGRDTARHRASASGNTIRQLRFSIVEPGYNSKKLVNIINVKVKVKLK